METLASLLINQTVGISNGPTSAPGLEHNIIPTSDRALIIRNAMSSADSSEKTLLNALFLDAQNAEEVDKNPSHHAAVTQSRLPHRFGHSDPFDSRHSIAPTSNPTPKRIISFDEIRLKNTLKGIRNANLMSLLAELLTVGWSVHEFSIQIFSQNTFRENLIEAGKLLSQTDQKKFQTKLEIIASVSGVRDIVHLLKIDKILTGFSAGLLNSVVGVALEMYGNPTSPANVDTVLTIAKQLVVLKDGSFFRLNDSAGKTIKSLIDSQDFENYSIELKKKLRVLHIISLFENQLLFEFAFQEPQLFLPIAENNRLETSAYVAFVKYAIAYNESSGHGDDSIWRNVVQIFYQSDAAPAVLATINEIFKNQPHFFANTIQKNADISSLMTEGMFNETLLLYLSNTPKGIDLLKQIVLSSNSGSVLKISTQANSFWEQFVKLDEKTQSFIVGLSNDNTSTESMRMDFELIQKLMSLLSTTSPELQKRSTEILYVLLKDPKTAEQKLHQIIFSLESSLPDIIKIFELFLILYVDSETVAGKSVIETILKNNLLGLPRLQLSPILSNASSRRRNQIIYNDLLRIHLEAANPSLLNYLHFAEQSQRIIDRVIEGESISPQEKEQVELFIQQCQVILTRTPHNVSSHSNDFDIKAQIEKFQNQLTMKKNQKILDRLIEIFFGGIGLKKYDDVINYVSQQRLRAHNRNTTAYDTDQFQKRPFNVAAGDLLKGVNLDFVDGIFSNGNVAPQFNSFYAADDMTAFDTDTSRVNSIDISSILSTALRNSIATEYATGSNLDDNSGGLVVVVRDRNQFEDSDSGSGSSRYSREKLERFYSNTEDENQPVKRHVGIRTGFPPTEIDAFIALEGIVRDKKKLESLFLYIALNGIFIPVVDRNGNYLFSPDDYTDFLVDNQDLKKVFQENQGGVELLTILRKSKGFEGLLDEQLVLSGGEQLSLFTHTQNVITQYQRYFEGRNAQQLLTEQQMLIMLSLHDIGKTLSQRLTGSSKRQHEYTNQLVPRLLQESQWSHQNITLILETISQDYLGSFFQDHISIEDVVNAIINVSRKTLVEPEQLLQLWLVYYQCDASAYTSDAGNPRSLDHLFVFDRDQSSATGFIKLSSDLLQKVSQLEIHLKQTSNSPKIFNAEFVSQPVDSQSIST